MTTEKTLDGKTYAGNPHVWFDEGEGAPAATPRRGPLLRNGASRPALALALCLCLASARAETINVLALGAKFAPYAAGEHVFRREIIAAAPPPAAPGLSVKEWPGVHTVKTRGPRMSKDQPTVVTIY